MAPSFINSNRVQAHPEYYQNPQRYTGDIEVGQSYTGIIITMGDQSDEWVASVASFVRANFENEAHIQCLRKLYSPPETADQKSLYTYRRTDNHPKAA
ncbi:MAG: hypothetical protein R3B93_24395 [Bacteroidia bacterium]